MEQKEEVLWFNSLITAACILTGLLAGGSVDRYLVQVPAWRHLSVMNWAAYSRYAEFGNGLYLYPFEVLGSFILLFTITAIVLIHKASFQHIAVPVHLATLFTTIGLVLTFFTFPIIFSVQTMANDETLVQHAFDKFHFWGLLRAVAQLISFIACVWVFTKKCNNTRKS
ncbi:MAG: hypothetical protein Q8918_12700 [Bacteroidota bacterium]|nr:hypothetical protein [Bacteroidota bacterium]MDP4250961.1 hypothetical protein [Bacteroidota bacterium]